jgi:outer membrane protein
VQVILGRIRDGFMSQSLRQRVLTASLSLGLAAGLAASARAETLADAIAEAYQNNPNLQAQRANQRALDENYVQARTGWRPTLSLQAQGTFQEFRTPRSSPLFFQRGGSIVRGNDTVGQFAFSQPIWTGGRTAAAVSAANADVLQGREQLRQIESQLLQQVITAYADVLRDQQVVRVQQDNVKLLQSQLEENRARFDVGEVTRTDVAQSQSRLANAQAQLQSAEAQLGVSRASYAALVGHNPGELAAVPSLDYLMPGNVDDAFTIAEQNSPALRAQQYAEEASRARIAQARAGRMPDISLQSTLAYTGGSIVPWSQRGVDTEKTATFNITVPLFTGGLTSSQIRQAIERNNSDRITVETQRRAVLQSITQSWNQLLASRANITATDEQVRAANIAFEGMHEEQQVGLRSTLDVLIAEQDLASARVSQATARHDAYVLSAILLASMGRLEARNLIPSQPQYDPKANFRRLRFTWGWVPWEEPIGAIDRFVTFPQTPQARELPREPAIGQGLQAQPPATLPGMAPLNAPAPSAVTGATPAAPATSTPPAPAPR